MDSIIIVTPIIYHPCIQPLSPSLLLAICMPYLLQWCMLRYTEGGWRLSGESWSLDKTHGLTTWAQQLLEPWIYRTHWRCWTALKLRATSQGLLILVTVATSSCCLTWRGTFGPNLLFLAGFNLPHCTPPHQGVTQSDLSSKVITAALSAVNSLDL